MYIYRRSCRSLSLMLSCLTVSFSCGIVYSRGNRTPETQKKQTSVYLIKRKMKKKILYRYNVYPHLRTPYQVPVRYIFGTARSVRRIREATTKFFLFSLRGQTPRRPGWLHLCPVRRHGSLGGRSASTTNERTVNNNTFTFHEDGVTRRTRGRSRRTYGFSRPARRG